MFHSLVRTLRCSGSYGRFDTVVGSTTITRSQLQNPSSPSSVFSRFVSSLTVLNSNQLFTVDYLVNSCGLSPESAFKASQRLTPNPQTATTKPDAVLSLLRTYGFTQPQISKLISVHPSLLLADPERTLKSKLEFLSKIGNVGELLCNDRSVLRRSLDKEIVPSIKFLKSLSLTDTSIALILRGGGWILNNAQGKLVPKIAVLKKYGVPLSTILKFIVKRPRCFYMDIDKFEAFVLQLNKMGVDISSMAFCRYLEVLTCKKHHWDAKLEVYRSFGWSEDEVLSMFKKQPKIMAISEKKIDLALDFFMNRLKWNRDDFAVYPVVILYSLGNRIIPRCYVIQILLSNGLINKPKIGYVLTISEKRFSENFVIKYQKVLPDLLSAFSRKISATEIQFGSEDDNKIDTV